MQVGFSHLPQLIENAIVFSDGWKGRWHDMLRLGIPSGLYPSELSAAFSVAQTAPVDPE
jgi:hypothetical protein